MTTEPLPDQEKPPTILFEMDAGLLTVPLATMLIIGRRADNPGEPQPHIDLSPFGADHKGVSRRHLRLSVAGNTIYVADLGSLNGTWLNGQRLSATIEYPVRHGDELRLGALRITVRVS